MGETNDCAHCIPRLYFAKPLQSGSHYPDHRKVTATMALQHNHLQPLCRRYVATDTVMLHAVHLHLPYSRKRDLSLPVLPPFLLPPSPPLLLPSLPLLPACLHSLPPVLPLTRACSEPYAPKPWRPHTSVPRTTQHARTHTARAHAHSTRAIPCASSGHACSGVPKGRS